VRKNPKARFPLVRKNTILIEEWLVQDVRRQQKFMKKVVLAANRLSRAPEEEEPQVIVKTIGCSARESEFRVVGQMEAGEAGLEPSLIWILCGTRICSGGLTAPTLSESREHLGNGRRSRFLKMEVHVKLHVNKNIIYILCIKVASLCFFYK